MNINPDPHRQALALRAGVPVGFLRPVAPWLIARLSSPVILLVMAGALALAPAMIHGVPYGPDLPGHLRNTLAFDRSLREGHLYPGWVAESNHGYGDTTFRVYPPALFYLLTSTHAITGDWYAGTLLTMTLLSILGCLGVYFWASSLFSQSVALWAGALFAFAPFHVNELYQASLLAEFAGGAVLAFVFGFAERVCRKGRMQDIAGLSIAYAVLIYTHIPLAMMGSLALPVYALVRMEGGKLVSTGMKLTLAASLGLAASACYWTTLVAELTWSKADQIDPGVRYDYRHNFLFQAFQQQDVRGWWASMLGLATLAFVLPAFAPSRQRLDGAIMRGSTAVKLLILATFIMATELSMPLWAVIPKLGSIEYPWRWLSITSVAGSIGVATGLHFWKSKFRSHRPLAMLAFGSLVIAIAFTFFQPVRGAVYLPRPQFDALLQTLPGSESYPESWPIWSTGPAPSSGPQVEASERSVTVHSWESQRRTFGVAPGQAVEARVRTFYYPGWVARAGGRDLPMKPAADGSLLISLPPEPVTVELTFREPLRVRISDSISALGFGLIVAMLLASWRQRVARSLPVVA